MLKYKIFVLFFFIIGLLSFNIVNLKEKNLSLLGKVIYLDAGYGGLDPGTIYKDINEKDINLKISLELEKKLERLGAIVYQTRYGDYDLSFPGVRNRKKSDLSIRSIIINKSNCDLFISIHLNSEETGIWSKGQVFYDKRNKKNEEIAKIMQKEINKNLGGKRKYKNLNYLYLQKRIEKPGILIEVGFLSNANDRYLLTKNKYQEKVSKTIVNGIVKYFIYTK